MCQQKVSLQVVRQCFEGFYVGPCYKARSFTGCFCAQRKALSGQRGLVNMPAHKSNYVLHDQSENPYCLPEELPEPVHCAPEQYSFEYYNQPQVAVGRSIYIHNNGLPESYFHPADKGPSTAIERTSPGAFQGIARVDRRFSGSSDKCFHISSDGNSSSQEKIYPTSVRHDADRVTLASEPHPSVVQYATSDKNTASIVGKSPASVGQNLYKFGWFSGRTDAIEDSDGRHGEADSTTSIPRQFSGGSFSGSSDATFPTAAELSLNKTNSTYVNSLHKTPKTRYSSKEKAEEEKKPQTEPDPASWAQQTEQDYNLQAALALRLVADAELISETQMIRQHFRETSCSAARRSVEATAHRFWVNGSLGYNDVVQDGFYHIWGMNPHVWTMCNHPQEGNKLPSLESLRAVNPAHSSIEVVLVDKNGDSHLRELVRDMESKAKILAKSEEHPDARLLAELLGTRVCMLLGGEASSEHGELLLRWKESTQRLKDCLSSIVLPLGSLSVGLCRHRALLFKTLADSINLPCRIASGCKYCGSDQGASCMVLCEPEREYYVDLIARPGHLSSPDSVWTNRSWSFCSPLRFPDFKRSFSGEDRSWSRSFGTDVGSSCGSADSQYQDEGAGKRGQKGPRQWVSSGSAEMTFSDDTHGAELWAVMRVSEERVNNLFKDQLQCRRRDGRGPAKILSSGNLSFVARVNSDSMSLVNVKVVAPSQKSLSFQDENSSEQLSKNSSASDEAPGEHIKFCTGMVESSAARKNLEQLSTTDDWEIGWGDVILKERVGAGSFGTVHRADWNGSDVAVKVLMQQDVHDEGLKEFLREVAIMKRLRHPNVVLFMGAVTVPPNLSIITEYLSRGSLFRILHKSPVRDLLDEKRRLRMAFDVAKGMNYLHRSNPPIVHRDLKSPNLLVDKTWTVKVCDFGLSRFKGNTFLSSRSGAGTPEWMAPEVLRGEPSNEKSDIYSFGVVLWELITMQLPWSGLSPVQVVGAVGFQHRRLQIPKDLHPDITSIIETCWANDPQDRPSFANIMESLKEFQKKSSVLPFHGLSAKIVQEV